MVETRPMDGVVRPATPAPAASRSAPGRRRWTRHARLLPLVAAMPLAAQTPVRSPPPTLPSPAILPPGPVITDWQPRSRAVTGGRIVLMGTELRPAELRAVIGPSKYPLPVRLATSTATRIELDVPEDALGKVGELVVGYAGTRSTTVEANYRIDPPMPSLLEATADAPLVPWLPRPVRLAIREFPGTRLNINDVEFSSGCGFGVRGGTVFGTATRESDLTLRFSVWGWFEQAGTCLLRVRMPALNDAGARVVTVEVTASFTVQPPTTYTFAGTELLAVRLRPAVVNTGFLNVCQGSDVGVRTIQQDIAFVVRGNVTDVKCAYRTEAWLLPAGFRLAEIRFVESSEGTRCGPEGSRSDTYPQVWHSFRRGAVSLTGGISDNPSDFTASGSSTITFDGVTYASGLVEPRQVLLPLYVGVECASTLTLGSPANVDVAVGKPQSITLRLDRVVLTGPPGFTLNDVVR
jgi:hypothetical protein